MPLASLRSRAMPEGRQVARVTCRRCGYAAEMSLEKFRGLYGAALFKRLRCSQCGARDADGSVRWEVPALRALNRSDEKPNYD
jgi:ribosomal protein S27AE